MENGASSEGKDPAGFLSQIIGAPVTVKLNSGVVYKGMTLHHSRLKIYRLYPKIAKGELQSVDGYMNIALEKTEEFVNGQLRKVYGDAFVRGNNGMHYESLDHADFCADHACSHVYFIRLVNRCYVAEHCWNRSR